jgi:uncharacterized peroxidase-related enzyme
MQTLKSIEIAGATGKTKQIFDGMQKHFGMVPNMARVLANSPAALNAYVSFDGALAQGTLPAPLREQIAIAVANANACDYCLSAHTLLGGIAGLDQTERASAQKAESHDAKAAAALRFAVKVVRERGLLAPSEVETLRAAGYSEGEVAEIVAAVAINIFTNYFNNIVGTDIDFPLVQKTGAGRAA